MPEANTFLIVGFCLVLLTPLVLYCFGNYEPPTSFREALKGIVTNTVAALLAFAVFAIVVDFFNFKHLSWKDTAAGIVAGGILRIIIDAVVLWRRQGKSEI